MNTNSNLLTNELIGDIKLFSAPLGAVKKGHLEITSGISNLDLMGDPEIQVLFQGQFSGVIPEVQARKELVRIHYRLSIADWFKHMLMANRQTANVSLNTSIPWQIDIHGGAAHVDADLRALQLSSLDFAGGVAETDILLPRPSGTVPIHLASGVSRLTIFHPEGVSARLKIAGGVSNVTLDDRSFGSVGGGIHLETPDYKDKVDRYDIRICGGVSNLVIRTHA